MRNAHFPQPIAHSFRSAAHPDPWVTRYALTHGYGYECDAPPGRDVLLYLAFNCTLHIAHCTLLIQNNSP